MYLIWYVVNRDTWIIENAVYFHFCFGLCQKNVDSCAVSKAANNMRSVSDHSNCLKYKCCLVRACSSTEDIHLLALNSPNLFTTGLKGALHDLPNMELGRLKTIQRDNCVLTLLTTMQRIFENGLFVTEIGVICDRSLKSIYKAKQLSSTCILTAPHF